MQPQTEIGASKVLNAARLREAVLPLLVLAGGTTAMGVIVATG
ncbi:hypothetical protein [Streptomyces qaidamensis]|nr:hypothetical protein [Streptomyces qaidamensis]